MSRISIRGLLVLVTNPEGQGSTSYSLSLRRRLATRTHKGNSLRIAAFSDYRVQDLRALIDFLKTKATPDLVLYAGDDIHRFQPRGKNLFEEIARVTKYGVCAVAGNDDQPSIRKQITGRKVFPVHSCALVLGNFAIVGLEGAPLFHGEAGKNIGRLLYPDGVATLQTKLWNEEPFRKKRLIIVSHAPPLGTLDFAIRFGPRRIGSKPLCDFLESSSNAILCVCGHVHRCGGQTATVGKTVVVNAASHDSPGDPGKVAIIRIKNRKVSAVVWHQLP